MGLDFPTGLTIEEVRKYEQMMQEKTNSKVKSNQNNTGEVAALDLYCTEIPQEGRGNKAGETTCEKTMEVQKQK